MKIAPVHHKTLDSVGHKEDILPGYNAMTKHFGRSYVATPGPSIFPERVLRAMCQPAPNIYAPELETLVAGINEDLKTVAGTKHYTTTYISNGHGAWEASVINLFNPGDEVLVLSTGIFAPGWGDCAKALGVTVHALDFGLRASVDLDRFAEKLRRDKDKRIKAILVTHVDTSTSVRNDIHGIAQVLKSLDHPALLAVDCIASLACDRFAMDEWGADVVLAASQKGLMTPPGLSFLFFNERARSVAKGTDRRTLYWNWERRIEPEEFYLYFCGTAPTHHLFGLREALNMIVHEEGLPQVYERHELMAQMIWAAAKGWGSGGPVELNIPKADDRSRAVSAVRVGAPHGKNLRNWTEENAGLTLGIGLGMATKEDPRSTGFFRIGHMGHLNGNMILGLLGTIEAGLEHLGVSRGSGAIDQAAKVLAEG